MKEKNKRVRHLGRKVNILVSCLMVVSVVMIVQFIQGIKGEHFID